MGDPIVLFCLYHSWSKLIALVKCHSYSFTHRLLINLVYEINNDLKKFLREIYYYLKKFLGEIYNDFKKFLRFGCEFQPRSFFSAGTEIGFEGVGKAPFDQMPFSLITNFWPIFSIGFNDKH